MCAWKNQTRFRQKTFLFNRYRVNLIPFRVFCQLEEPTNGYDRIIKSSPFLISFSNHSLEKFLDFKRWKKNSVKWCRIAPNGLIWSIHFQNFPWRACSQTPQKGLPPSTVTIVLFNHYIFRSWFLIFSCFKWSVPALWYRPFTCNCVLLFSELWIYLHLYIVKEGFSFFLMNIFHSLLIRYGRGGRGRRRSVITFRFVS